MSGSLNNIALAGIRTGFESLQRNASQIARKDNPEGDDTQSLVEAVVDLKANVQQVSASMEVLNVSDELIGTLLDVTA